MSSGRRPPPPDLKGTLGTLIRSTLEQVGAMTEVARREATRQRTRLDGALLERRRQAALAALGARVYELYEAGDLELEDLPELAAALEEVARFDHRRDDSASEAHPRSPREAWAGMPRSSDSGDPGRVWRPPTTAAEPTVDAELEEPDRLTFAVDGPGDPDDDLAEYMNPADVAPRAPTPPDDE